MAAGPLPAQPADTTRVVLLGSGNPNPDPDRSGPAVAVIAGGHPYLVDCGTGVVRRAEAARRNGVEALDVQHLDIVFLTHLHSDHTLGCPDLLLTPWVMRRASPLRVFGPPGTRALFDGILAAYDSDIRNRSTGLQPHNDTGWRAEVTEIAAGTVYEDSVVRVTAFEVPHAGWEHALAYRFETVDRTIVISGDIGPSEQIIEACVRCDVLLHEVYSQAAFDSQPAEWQRYHGDAHTSSTQLAEIARRARPRLLVLYHQLFWGASEEELLAEVKRGYEGETVSGHDLDIY
ncbi:MAG TPA: MBL fold metallo-hydrolase [Gemmatimonadota bacterium]|nr:MBL fold metallo-hydrolase [Gemmatimonadota bacterium]